MVDLGNWQCSLLQLQTKTDEWLVEGMLFSKFMKLFNTFKTTQIDFYNCTFSSLNCTIRHQLHTKICPGPSIARGRSAGIDFWKRIKPMARDVNKDRRLGFGLWLGGPSFIQLAYCCVCQLFIKRIWWWWWWWIIVLCQSWKSEYDLESVFNDDHVSIFHRFELLLTSTSVAGVKRLSASESVSVSLSVCVSDVRTMKPKRLKLKSPNLAHGLSLYQVWWVSLIHHESLPTS